MTHAVVVVPGILGSELRLGDDLIWPGPLKSLIFAYDDMDRLLLPDLQVGGLIRKFSVSSQYQSLIDDLATCEFYEDSDPRTLYQLPYDWRKDNREAAAKLAELLDNAVTKDGVTEISIIGHSMGGLVSRYYLESGDYKDKPGLKAVHRLITLGTPHRGAPLALSAALGLQGRLFLSAAQVHLIAKDPRYPSLYQLLPPRGEPYVWNDDAAADFGELDIYDDGLASALGLEPKNLKAAVEFQSKLDINHRPQINGKPIRYFFFTGTHQTTVSVVRLLEMKPNEYRTRPIEVERSGDGTVPAWSGALTGVQGQAVGGEHGTIYRNDALRTTLAVLLGKKGVLAGPADRVEVSLRDRVASPDSPVHVSLGFTSKTAHLDGELVIQRIETNDDETVSFAAPTASYKLAYTGPETENISVVFSAPTHPDIYRVAYIPAGHSEPAGSDELFVQQS